MMTDPIADMLTRIRNGNDAKHEMVSMPGSKIKHEIANILLEEGYVTSVDFKEDNKQGTLKINLKYGPNNQKVISGIKRISKPGLKVYVKSTEVPKVLGGLGIAMISTSQGIMTDRQARDQGIGGEVICYIW